MLILNSFVIPSIRAIDVNYWVVQVALAAWEDARVACLKKSRASTTTKDFAENIFSLCWVNFICQLMLHSQDSFYELEQILRSLQENLEPGSKVISTDPAPHNGSDEDVDEKGPKKLQEIPVFKVEFCDELSVEDILMEILLHQQLHTSKEYTINGLSFKVDVLDDTELWSKCGVYKQGETEQDMARKSESLFRLCRS